ncbi:MAG TPA: hypothetical protein VIO38_17265 [Rariglobus sp.]
MSLLDFLTLDDYRWLDSMGWVDPRPARSELVWSTTIRGWATPAEIADNERRLREMDRQSRAAARAASEHNWLRSRRRQSEAYRAQAAREHAAWEAVNPPVDPADDPLPFYP